MLNKFSDHIIKTKVLLLVISLIISGSLTGCGILGKITGQQTNQKQEQSDQIPKQLKNLESTIEDIFTALNGPGISKDKEQDKGQDKQDQEKQGQEKQGQEEQGQEPKEQKDQQEQGQAQQGQQQEDQQQKDQQQKDQQQKDQQQKDQQQKDQQQETQTKDPWQKVTQAVKDLHLSWNEYMPEITKKGGSKELLDGFSDALNHLTEIAEGKDKQDTLLAANQVYAHVAGIYGLYKTKEPPELKRISYFTRNAVLTSLSGDWSKASSDLEEVKTRWALVKNSVGQEEQEDSAKLDLSIYELEKVIKDKNKDLAEIKGSITLENIQSLEKAIEKE